MEGRAVKFKGQKETVVVDRVRTEKDVRLFMQVLATLPSGRRQTLSVLIDTGAEVSLVREGLFDPVEFRSTKRKVNLTTANGERLRGGRGVWIWS